MKNANKIGIFLASIIVIAGCQMGESKEATHSVAASPTPTASFVELSSNTVSGSIGITNTEEVPEGFSN